MFAVFRYTKDGTMERKVPEQARIRIAQSQHALALNARPVR